MDFYTISNEINKYVHIKKLFNYLDSITKERKGYGYYKYPLANLGHENTPDIIVIDLEYGILGFEFSEINLGEIVEFDNNKLVLANNQVEDSLLAKIDDFEIDFRHLFDENRILRKKIIPNFFLVFPNINKSEFITKFPEINVERIIFNDYCQKAYDDYWVAKSRLNETESSLFKAIAQGFSPFNNYKHLYNGEKSSILGDAIKLIDYRINSLDEEQLAAAIQIPDGPQRIRGMAGTGKTIILAMKAALLHSKYPEKKILYTFHTQSLYNQVKNLITLFYRKNNKIDPNWDNLLIRHSWGSGYKEGVYYRTCLRNSIPFISYSNNVSLDFVCLEALKKQLDEEFDYVLIDEAQDFPPAFFQLIHKTTKSPKCIIFAYDELQSLDNIKELNPNELFGYDENGKPKVDFSIGSYGNGIEIDYTLKKSYRNPIDVLMLAHGIGLGLYNPNGIMQVIDDIKIWNSIGYDVIEGECKENDKMTIKRPKENSVSAVHEFYNGNEKVITYNKFNTRNEEIEFVANSIRNDIIEQKVLPHHIIVITLSNNHLKENFSYLQKLLFEKKISSINPGFDTSRDAFGEVGSVTLSTVYKAKGNEAFIVYIIGLDYLYDFVDFLETRNKVFTCISRTKGWCRLSGITSNMEKAIKEIESIQNGINKDYIFEFKYPTQDKIARKLSTEEHSKRLEIKKIGENSIKNLLKIDKQFIKNLPNEIIDELIRKLKE